MKGIRIELTVAEIAIVEAALRYWLDTFWDPDDGTYDELITQRARKLNTRLLRRLAEHAFETMK